MKALNPFAGMGPLVSGLTSSVFGQLQGWGPAWTIVVVAAMCFLLPIPVKSGVGIGNALQRVCEFKILTWFGVPPAQAAGGSSKRTRAPTARPGLRPP